jgi:hypothetical protein
MASFVHFILMTGCILVAIVALFLSVLFMAFADSPDSNLAVRRALTPGMIWAVAALIIASYLIKHHVSWWYYPLAYLVAASPPFVLFGLTAVLMSLKKPK